MYQSLLRNYGVCGGTPSHSIRQFTTLPESPLPARTKPQCQSEAFLGLLELSMHTAQYMCVAFQISRNMSRTFQSLHGHRIPLYFHLIFSINILFSPPVIISSNSN